MNMDLFIIICVSTLYLLIPIITGLKSPEEREKRWKLLFFRQSVWTMAYSMIITERFAIIQGKTPEPLQTIIFFIPILGFALILGETVSKLKESFSRKK